MVSTYERRVLATDYTAVYKFCTNASFDLKKSETGGLRIDAGCRNHASTRDFSTILWVSAKTYVFFRIIVYIICHLLSQALGLR